MLPITKTNYNIYPIEILLASSLNGRHQWSSVFSILIFKGLNRTQKHTKCLLFSIRAAVDLCFVYLCRNDSLHNEKWKFIAFPITGTAFTESTKENVIPLIILYSTDNVRYPELSVRSFFIRWNSQNPFGTKFKNHIEKATCQYMYRIDLKGLGLCKSSKCR